MMNFRVFAVAFAVAIGLSIVEAHASVTIELVYHVLNFGNDTTQTTGSYSNSITNELLFAATDANIGVDGHFMGVNEIASYVNPDFGAQTNAALLVFFNIDESYHYSFDATQTADFPNFGYSQSQLYSYVTNSEVEFFDGSGVFQSQGDIPAGEYLFRSDIYGVSPSNFAMYGKTDFDFQLTPIESQVVPEPASIAVWTCLGVAGLCATRWRKRRAEIAL